MTVPLPLPSFHFTVEIAGFGTGSDNAFSEVSGLEAEHEVQTVNEGGENRYAHRLPGRVSYRNLVLRRGVFPKASRLRKWCFDTLEGGLARQIVPRNIDVMLLDASGDPVLVWNVTSAWPVKMEVSAMQSSENELLIETIEFAFAHFTRRDAV